MENDTRWGTRGTFQFLDRKRLQEISASGGNAMVAKYGVNFLREMGHRGAEATNRRRREEGLLLGFAGMPAEKLKAAGKKGGTAAQKSGRAHRYSQSEAKVQGSRGGRANFERHGQEFYRELGRKSAAARAEKRRKAQADQLNLGIEPK